MELLHIEIFVLTAYILEITWAAPALYAYLRDDLKYCDDIIERQPLALKRTAKAELRLFFKFYKWLIALNSVFLAILLVGFVSLSSIFLKRHLGLRDLAIVPSRFEQGCCYLPFFAVFMWLAIFSVLLSIAKPFLRRVEQLTDNKRRPRIFFTGKLASTLWNCARNLKKPTKSSLMELAARFWNSARNLWDRVKNP